MAAAKKRSYFPLENNLIEIGRAEKSGLTKHFDVALKCNFLQRVRVVKRRLSHLFYIAAYYKRFKKRGYFAGVTLYCRNSLRHGIGSCRFPRRIAHKRGHILCVEHSLIRNIDLVSVFDRQRNQIFVKERRKTYVRNRSGNFKLRKRGNVKSVCAYVFERGRPPELNFAQIFAAVKHPLCGTHKLHFSENGGIAAQGYKSRGQKYVF